MLDFIKEEILMPTARRIGTIAGTGLVTLGATVEQSNQIGLGASALAVFLAEVAIRWYVRRQRGA